MRSGVIRRLNRFSRARGGAVAVEYAFLLLPFLTLIFAVLEVALLFLATASLDTAMEKATRRIRTGTFQASYSTLSQDAQQTELKDAICDEVTWLTANCTTRLTVDVRNLGASWRTVSSRPGPWDSVNRTFDPDASCFAPSGPQDIVLVRAWYSWPLLTPFLNQAVSRLDSSRALITATQAFRNEPFAPPPAPATAPTACP